MAEGRRINEGERPGMAMRSALFAIAVTLATVIAGPIGSARAVAPGFTHFSVTPSSTQAGGHPDVAIELRWVNTCEESTCFEARVLRTHFPTGFIGNPHVPPRCTLTELSLGACPVDSQIGAFEFDGGGQAVMFPAYNMETRPDQAGLVAAVIPFVSAPLFLDLSGRTDGDYGLDAVSTPLLHVGINNITFHLWGVPADPAHDYQRFVTPLEGFAACPFPTKGCSPGQVGQSPTFASASVPLAPFMQSPTTCGVPLSSGADIEYYGGVEVHADSPWPAMTGCQQLSFDPSLTVKPTTTRADSASGVDVDLTVPQTQSPTTPSPSELRTARVSLPEGFSVNPNAADGKVACADADTAIGTLLGATCPEFSKVGTLTLDAAALPAPIPGALYLGEPKPGDRYRLVLTADGFATHLKLVGSIHLDPQTGRLTVEFAELPQQTLQEMSMHFFGSERGLLATPTQCGKYEVRGEFVPWDSALNTRFSNSVVTIDSGPNGAPCPNGPRSFVPKLTAGTSNSTAGMHAPFSLMLSREDGEQNLTGLSVKTPPGFTATLKGTSYCPEAAIAGLVIGSYPGLAEQASSTCPEASQIGTAVAGAGAGTHPLYVPGKVYLAGPYKGAPLSLLVVIPAVSGPYDLGNVAVRAALNVDQTTAQVTTVSDPLPQILEGVPLRTRYIQVNLDRPNFALNPTNCDPFAVNATVSGGEGALANLSSHFQVANCADLPYGPKLALKMTGATKRTGHPALTAALSAKPGEANTKLAQVTLPHAQFLDTAHINAPCTRVQFAANACPANSQVGTAKALTPLLEEPLEGPVYLRTSTHNLPDLVADLRGRFHVVLVGRVDTIKERIRSSFETTPDVPVTSFTLSLYGGRKGLLVNSENLCRAPQRALVRLGGQNGISTKRNTTIANPCAKQDKQARAKRQAAGQRSVNRRRGR